MGIKDTSGEKDRLLNKIKGKVSQTELAARTGLKRESVNRIFSGKRSPNLDSFILLCEASGFVITISERK